MRKTAGSPLRTPSRSGRLSSASATDGPARLTPPSTRVASKSGGSKLLLLPVDLGTEAPRDAAAEAHHSPLPQTAGDAVSHTVPPLTHPEPQFVERRVRAPVERRRPAPDAAAADHVEPPRSPARIAEPLPPESEDPESLRPTDRAQPPATAAPPGSDPELFPRESAPPPLPIEATRRPSLERPERRTAAPLAPEAEVQSSGEDAQASGELHFGSLLRRARERRGLSLADVADKTRISPRWLRALEDAQLDILPAPVFVSGYLRTYARLLGLDGADLLERYHSLARKRAQAQVPHERGFTVRRHGQPVLVPPWLLFLILLGLTGAVLAVLWLTNTFWRR